MASPPRQRKGARQSDSDAFSVGGSPTGTPPDTPQTPVGGSAGLPRSPRGPFPQRALLALLVLAALLAGAVVLATRAGRSHSQSPTGSQSASFDGNELTPLKAAPGLGTLHNYLGGPPVNLASFRGKAVLVTFLYTHCPTDCPLIASHLGLALDQLGAAAAKAQVIAVSVDPRSDDRSDVAAFLKAHGLTGRALYLLGNLHELAHVWQAWGVGAERDASDPELINHSALVYGIDASGRLRTVYLGGEWKPREVAHDVPLLAAQ
jgi:protein SCO1/2